MWGLFGVCGGLVVSKIKIEGFSVVEVGNPFHDRGYSFDQNVYFLRSLVHFSRLWFWGSGELFYQSHFLKIRPSYIFAGALSLDHGAHFQDLGSGIFDWPPWIFSTSSFWFRRELLTQSKIKLNPSFKSTSLKNPKLNIKVTFTKK